MDESLRLLVPIGMTLVGIVAVLVAVIAAVRLAKANTSELLPADATAVESAARAPARLESAIHAAYRMLYEQGDLRMLSEVDLRRRVGTADDILMRPLHEFDGKIDPEVVARVRDLHNILAQYRLDPSPVGATSQDARGNLQNYREQFLEEMEGIRSLLHNHLKVRQR